MFSRIFKKLSISATSQPRASRDEDQSTFAYRPLAPGEIRLLQPTYSTGSLTWTLSVAKLKEELDFDALSYVWGSQNRLYKVFCNGRRLMVHENLHVALPYLASRYKDPSIKYRPIWIDAICINQQDEDEKMVQISMMHLIYSMANMVWVWFGVSEVQNRVPEAISLLPKIIEATRNVPHEPLGPATEEEKEYLRLNNIHEGGRYFHPDESHGLNNLDAELWTAVQYLLNNPWFRRIWILQEAALAKTVVFLCCEHEIAFDMLREAIRIPFHRIYLRDTEGNRIDMETRYAVQIFLTRLLVQDAIGSYEFASIATSAMLYSDCYQPQDRVLGLIGLFHNPDDPEIVNLFQYALGTYRSIPGLYHNFTTTVLAAIDGYQWWQWLSLAFSYGRMRGLPSWVPDLHHLGEGYSCQPWVSIMLMEHRHECRYKASTRPANVTVIPGSPELTLEGIVCDRVAVVHPERLESEPETDVGMMIKWVFEAVKWEQSLAATFIDDLSLDDGRSLDGIDEQISHPRVPLETYWHALMAGMCVRDGETYTLEHYLEYRTVMYRFIELLDQYNYLECILAGQGEPAILPGDEEELEDLARKVAQDSVPTRLNAFFGMWHSREVFVTEGGRMGFTLRGVKPGDMVCVFSGSWTPYIIRRANGNGSHEPDRYKFVGDAYVTGLMDGESDEMDGERKAFVMV